MCKKCWRSHTVVVEDEGVGPLLLESDKYSHAKTADRRMLVVAQIRHEKAAKKKKKKKV